MPNIANQLQLNDEATRALISQKSAEQAPIIDKAMQTAQQPIPGSPQLQKAPAPVPKEDLSEAQNWMTAIAAFSGLAGAFSRQHATTALNAFSAGMKGFKEGKEASVEEAHKQWDEANKAALENNKALRDQYEDILNNRKLTQDQQLQQIQLIAAKYQDQLTYQAAEAKNMILLSKVLESQAAAHEKAAEAWEKIRHKENEDAKSDMAEYDEWKTDQASINKADAYAKGVGPSELVKGMGKNSGKQLDYIIKLASERHPDLDISKATIDYSGKKREAAAIAARSAPAKIAVKEMDKLSQPMVDAIEKLDPTNYPDLNSLRNAYEKKTGGPEVVRAALAVQEFKTAFTNLMVRNGVPTDAARGKADELMDKNFSLDQIEAVVDQAKVSGAAVLDALDEAKGNSVAAPKEVDPELWKHLTPEERSLWQTSP